MSLPKAPSKNVSASLRGQRVPGRAPLQVSTSEMKRGVTMTVPGEGGVEEPAGVMHDRSVAKYTGPMRRYGGG